MLHLSGRIRTQRHPPADEKLEGARSLVQGTAKELVAVDGSRDALAPDRPDFLRSGHAATALEPNLFSLTAGFSEGHYELDGRPGHNMLITHDEVGAGRTHIASLADNFYVTIADADDVKGKLQTEPLRSAAPFSRTRIGESADDRLGDRWGRGIPQGFEGLSWLFLTAGGQILSRPLAPLGEGLIP